jgi:hypothetical protein
MGTAMSVRLRDSVIAFVAILAFAMALATAARAECVQCVRVAPPPPRQPCLQCRAPEIVTPRAHPPQGPRFSVNAAARAQASAFSVSVAHARTGDTVVRTGEGAYAGDFVGVMSEAAGGAQAEASAAAAAQAASLAILERAVAVSAECVDASGYARPAAQTFAEREPPAGHGGELYRCTASTRVRVHVEGAVFDCATGDAVWYENAELSCRRRLPRGGDHEARLWRSYGAGEKLVRVRDRQAVAASPAQSASFTSAGMDGGVGAGVW